MGVVLLAEVAVTLVWQEPLSALSARGDQNDLSEQLRKAESAALAAPTGFAVREREGPWPPCSHGGTGAMRSRASRWAGSRSRAWALNYVFVAGVSSGIAAEGPGALLADRPAGGARHVGIAGHRTTYLAPFRRMDELRRGDEVVVRMPYGRFRYRVQGSIVVSPANTAPLRRARYARLALTTCTPLFSAAKRLIVTARLRSSRLLQR